MEMCRRHLAGGFFRRPSKFKPTGGTPAPPYPAIAMQDGKL